MTKTGPTTFLDHLRELRKRLMVSAFSVVIGMIISLVLYKPLLSIMTRPFNPMDSSIVQHHFFVTTLFEGFVTKFKFAFLGGLVLSFPVHLFQLLRFVFPGLTSSEKRLIGGLLGLSFLLAVGSLWLAYTTILPLSVAFLTQSQFIPQEVGILLSFKSNVFYIFNFLMWSMVLFQFPIVLLGLLYAKLLSRKTLWSGSRYMVIFVFVISAIVTPPDAISQIMLSIPLICLYYLTLGLASLLKLGDA